MARRSATRDTRSQLIAPVIHDSSECRPRLELAVANSSKKLLRDCARRGDNSRPPAEPVRETATADTGPPRQRDTYVADVCVQLYCQVSVSMRLPRGNVLESRTRLDRFCSLSPGPRCVKLDRTPQKCQKKAHPKAPWHVMSPRPAPWLAFSAHLVSPAGSEVHHLVRLTPYSWVG
jgi:hypothetical protein